jgi:hypothetical protein
VPGLQGVSLVTAMLNSQVCLSKNIRTDFPRMKWPLDSSGEIHG